jgi:hypothetical protein
MPNITFNHLDLMEFILYVFYIYYLVFLAVIFIPNKYTISILVAYVYCTSWNIITPENCTSLSFPVRALFITMYTIGCAFAYKLIHYIYWKKPKYIFTLLFLPIIYFVTIKVCCYVFNCNTYSNFNYAIKMMQFGISSVKNGLYMY